MKLSSLFVTSALMFAGCAADVPESVDAGGKADSSAIATFWNMDWDGETISMFPGEFAVQAQLFYTIGLLNEHNSVGRLDKVTLTNLQTQDLGNGTFRISYHASLPVAWGRAGTPALTMALPMGGDFNRLADFVTAYRQRCIDPDHSSAANIEATTIENFWYYYRPGRCLPGGDAFRANSNQAIFAPADILSINPTFTRSEAQSSNKYPEYHKVWEDNELNVVAIFGKAEHDGNRNDEGVRGYNDFFAQAKAAASRFGQVDVAPAFQGAPGLHNPIVTITAKSSEGRTFRVRMMMTTNVQEALLADASFIEAYEQASTNADLIVYNGHAGLGANIRAISNAGKWKAGQYLIMFENGCDSYAYIDRSLIDAHKALNPDDSEGTMYVDELANAMPAWFRDMADSSMRLVNALLDYKRPMTYEQIMRSVARDQVILVTGDEDNVYQPGM